MRRCARNRLVRSEPLRIRRWPGLPGPFDPLPSFAGGIATIATHRVGASSPRMVGMSLLAMAIGLSPPETVPEPGSDPTDRCEGSQTDIECAAMQLENPLSNVTAAIIENNTNYIIGPNDRAQNTMLLQPIVPLIPDSPVNLIILGRIPLVWSPDITRDTGTTFGLADITLSLFAGSRVGRIFFWGVGPALRFPTGTNERLGPIQDSDQFSLGPTASLVVTPGSFVIGFIANNLWSVVGDDDADSVHAFFLQPFFNYNLPSGWYLVTAPTIVSDWTAPDGEEWVVPVGAGFGRVRLLPKVGGGLNFQVQAFWNALHPSIGPQWQLRFQVAFFLPRLDAHSG